MQQHKQPRQPTLRRRCGIHGPVALTCVIPPKAWLALSQPDYITLSSMTGTASLVQALGTADGRLEDREGIGRRAGYHRGAECTHSARYGTGTPSGRVPCNVTLRWWSDKRDQCPRPSCLGYQCPLFDGQFSVSFLPI